MARHTARIGTLRIPNTQSDSPGILSLQFGRTGIGTALGISIHAPAALTAVVTVEVQPFGDTVWRTLQSGGVDVTVAAGKTIVVGPCPFKDLRLHSAGAEGADRDFFIDSAVDSTWGA